MWLSLLELIKSLIFFTASYSNNIFPDPLTKEEEDKYIELAKLGDKDARNKLIEHNLRLVAHIVKKFDYKNVDQDDLISIGTIGLIKGVDSYSNRHGLSTGSRCTSPGETTVSAEDRRQLTAAVAAGCREPTLKNQAKIAKEIPL